MVLPSGTGRLHRNDVDESKQAGPTVQPGLPSMVLERGRERVANGWVS